MQPHHWPLYGLRLRTPRLELRLPELELLDDLASVAVDGVHPPADMPFTAPWTDASPAERGKAVPPCISPSPDSGPGPRSRQP